MIIFLEKTMRDNIDKTTKKTSQKGTMKVDKTKDNVVYVKTSEEAEEHNKEVQRQVQSKKTALWILVIIGIVAAGIIIYFQVNKEYTSYKIVKSNATDYENTANYIQFSGNLLKYTPDGVSYINSNGDTVWSAGIDMKMPMAVASGNYAVVADMSGNSVCVFSNEGQESNLTMPYSICDVDVANQGAFAVVLESEETNYINLYNKKGEIVYEIQTTIDKSGYPLDISISDDGEKLFTSYLNIQATKVQNNLAAYNFGDVGQNSNADRMVGGYMFDNQIISKVEFVDNDTVVAFGTKTISVYSMKEKPSEKAKLEFEQEIRSVFYSSEYFGIVQELSGDTEHLYVMKVYDMNGNLEFQEYIDFAYDNIYAADKEVIITGNSNCLIYRANGKIKFNGNLNGKIVSMVPSGNRLEYVVVYEDSTEIIMLNSGEESTSLTSTEEE